MKINWTKEQCIEYIENNLEKFTELEIELSQRSLKMMEERKEDLFQNFALENLQRIIEFYHQRKFVENHFFQLFPIIGRNDYWKERCFAAEKFIEESPCDYDIYPEQYEAYIKWISLKNKE